MIQTGAGSYLISDSAVVAAIVVAIASMLSVSLGLLWNGTVSRRERQRSQFADALSSVLRYWEFAYIVLRRSQGSQEDEISISRELSEVQRQLAHHQAWMKTGPVRIERRFSSLVDEARKTAGGALHAAWETTPGGSSGSMNIKRLDDSQLRAFEAAYISEVRDHLSLLPSLLRRAARGLFRSRK